MTDGTLFQANASLDSMIPRDKKVEHNLEINKVVPGIKPPKARKINNKTYISNTDPDASLAFKHGTVRSLKYKNHLTIDADSRIILDTIITTGSTHESQVYLDRVAVIEKEISIKIQTALFKNNCTAKKYKNSSVRSVPHNVHKELFDMVNKEMTTAPFRKNLSERMWKIEGLMSEIKCNVSR